MTSIKEEENDTINISKYNFSCDDEDPSIPEPLPKKSFSMLITKWGNIWKNQGKNIWE